MPRTKPKNWPAPDLALLRTDDLLSDETLTGIIDKHLGSGSRARAETACRRLRNVLGMFRVGLHDRHAPKESNIAAALKGLKEALSEADACFDSLDARSRDRLAEAVSRDTQWRHMNPFNDSSQAPKAYLRAIIDWTDTALGETGRSDVGGPVRDVERVAVKALLQVWKVTPRFGSKTAYPPTCAQFSPFVAAVLEPVRRAYPGHHGPLSSIVQEELDAAE